MIQLVAIALIFLIFSLFSRKLTKSLITAPMFFLFAGILLASDPFHIVKFEDIAQLLLIVGIAALGLSFFNDASRMNLSALRSSISLPARLLVIALPLMVLLGMLLAFWLIPDLDWYEAALLAVILTPADTGLISTVLNSIRVPERVRQAMNVESSLNDGLTTPIATIFIVLSQVYLGQESIRYRLSFPIQQIVIAVIVGILIGGIGGWALQKVETRKWIIPSFQGLVFPSLTVLAIAITSILKGNYFIACFVAGITITLFAQDINQRQFGFSETLMQILSLVVFLFLGAKLIEIWPEISWNIVLYAILSLTIVRMIPVAISMLGKGLQSESIFFLGWFGPRGLASIVLATIVAGHLFEIPHSKTIIATVTITVAISIILHGMSEIPLVAWYSNRMQKLHPEASENKPVEKIPFRLGWTQIATQTDQRIKAWEIRRSPSQTEDDNSDHQS